MEEQNVRLKIHTHEGRADAERVPQMREEDNGKQVQTKQPPEKKRNIRSLKTDFRRKPRNGQSGMTVGEKLLRNTAVACALLLTVMSLKNVDQPWSRKVTEGVKQAMTMRIDWDETLGRLSFVRALVPETALVFLNLGDRVDLRAPVEGVITHEFAESQPWIEYSCDPAQQVLAAADGVVTAAGQGAGGDWIILIQSEDGLETMYGYLDKVYVRSGQEVKEAQQIGATSDSSGSRLYFELRENGEAVDPAGRMK